MSQKNLFELVYILLDKKSVTAKNLAKHFGVSERTILRWAESLAEAGVPVYSTQGRYGGFAIAENSLCIINNILCIYLKAVI